MNEKNDSRDIYKQIFELVKFKLDCTYLIV